MYTVKFKGEQHKFNSTDELAAFLVPRVEPSDYINLSGIYQALLEECSFTFSTGHPLGETHVVYRVSRDDRPAMWELREAGKLEKTIRKRLAGKPMQFKLHHTSALALAVYAFGKRNENDLGYEGDEDRLQNDYAEVAVIAASSEWSYYKFTELEILGYCHDDSDDNLPQEWAGEVGWQLESSAGSWSLHQYYHSAGMAGTLYRLQQSDEGFTFNLWFVAGGRRAEN